MADKPVRALMTPRNEIAFLDRTDPRRDIVQALQMAQHNRLVVCDGTVDNVVGVVQAKDLLDQLLAGKELSVTEVLRQPMVVPDTISALDALERLRADPLGLALVMDEYGSFEGVVTAADVLEAIVGDANDTQPDLAPDALKTPGSLVVDGMMPVDELKARLVLPDLPAEGSYHTTAGLLLALLQRVPRGGRQGRVRGLAVRGAVDGWPARGPRPREPGGAGRRLTTACLPVAVRLRRPVCSAFHTFSGVAPACRSP